MVEHVPIFGNDEVAVDVAFVRGGTLRGFAGTGVDHTGARKGRRYGYM